VTNDLSYSNNCWRNIIMFTSCRSSWVWPHSLSSSRSWLVVSGVAVVAVVEDVAEAIVRVLLTVRHKNKINVLFIPHKKGSRLLWRALTLQSLRMVVKVSKIAWLHLWTSPKCFHCAVCLLNDYNAWTASQSV